MNYSIEFHPQARKDLIDATRWYRDIKPGLARRFRGEIDRIYAPSSFLCFARRRRYQRPATITNNTGR